MVRDDSDTSGGPFFAHDWGQGSPSDSCGVSSDNFSARWTRRQQFNAGRYRFTFRSDDGMRLFIDNALKLDSWVDQGATNHSVDVDLSTGQHDLRVEYYEHGGGAVAQIFWEQISSSVSPPTIEGYNWSTTPTANQPFNGTITGTGFVANGTQVFFCVNGTGTCYQHPAAGVTVNSSTSLSVSNVNLGAGSYQIYVLTSAGQSARSSSFTVISGNNCIATVPSANWKGEYYNNRTLTASPIMVRDDGINSINFDWGGGSPSTSCGLGVDNFSARWTRTVSFASGTYRFSATGDDGIRLYVDGGLKVDKWIDQPETTYQADVPLSAGNHTLTFEYYDSGGGAVARLSWTAVTDSIPTISGYSWNTTPTAGQPFNGTISGANFVAGGTQVFFCVNGTATCYQQPAAGVTVNNSSSLSVNNVNLGAGSYQIYVQTSAGQSSRSTAFTVQAPPQPPTISGYSWDRTPTAGQPFNGTISGSNFVAGGTQVFFCVSGTSTCYQQPAAGVTVNNSSSLSVSNVNLGAGSYQIYVQTSVGASARSLTFTVRAAAPTISGYSWSTTPRANQPFSGTISGSNFVVGGTQVFFCVNGTSTWLSTSSGRGDR
jgi:hypothetical protein